MPSASLTLFSHVAARPDAEIDLAEAALLVAEPEYPGLSVGEYVERLDRLANDARRSLEAQATAVEPEPDPERLKLEGILRFLHGHEGFHGNREDYYDPRNSYLNEVLERRTGIPITLSIVLVEVCRRLGVDAEGVAFPGHFLVRAPTEGGIYILDPFEGRLLDRQEMRGLVARATGAPRDPDARMLAPATRRQILVRLLHNLRGIYAERADLERLRPVLERMQVLSPSDELRAEVERLGGERPWPTRRRGLN